MARIKNNPCRVCGEMMWPSKYLPRGMSAHQSCAVKERASTLDLGDPNMECATCGVAIRAELLKGKWRKYCSRSCFMEALNGPVVEAQCDMCGCHFRGHSRQRFCSDRCSDSFHWHKRRAKKASASIGGDAASISAESVCWEFDWTCWICKWPIPKGTDGQSDLAGSVDHVVPLSRGGAHSWGNVRAAHRICNIVRGTSAINLAVRSKARRKVKEAADAAKLREVRQAV